MEASSQAPSAATQADVAPKGKQVTGRNLEVVRRLFTAVDSRGDPAGFEARWASYIAMYDPDVIIHEAASLPYGGAYAGEGAVARHAIAYSDAWNALQEEGDSSLQPRFFADGDEVLVLWRQRGRSPDGARFDMPAVSLYTLKDGRVAESRMFHFDSLAARDFLVGSSAASEEADRTT